MRKIFNFQFTIFNSKGFTLLELLVAMGIFLTVITLAVGSVVSAQRFHGRANLNRQLQQLARDVAEKISTEIKNANGWVEADGKLRPETPFVVAGNQLTIRRHKGLTNFLIIFQTTGDGKLQIGSAQAAAGSVPSAPDSFQDLIGPVGPTVYKLTSQNIFTLNGSFASASTQQPSTEQPRVTVSLLPLEATFGAMTVNMTLSFTTTSRFYNFKYAY